MCSIALILLEIKSRVIMLVIGFTYLHHPEQPLAHSSVSSYQRLYSPASNKVHSCTSSLSATLAAGTGWWTGEHNSLASSQEQHVKFSSNQLKLTNIDLQTYKSLNLPWYLFYITGLLIFKIILFLHYKQKRIRALKYCTEGQFWGIRMLLEYVYFQLLL